MFVSVAVGSVLFRWIGEVYFPGRVMWNLLPPGYLDSFAVGALLAYQNRSPNAAFAAILRRSGTIIVACFLLAVLRKRMPGWHLVFLDPLLFAIAYMCLINVAANGARGLAGRVLDQPLFRYAGRISYGLYIAHNFAPLPVQELLVRFPALLAVPRIQLVLMTIWTMAVAMLSWHFFEAPINALKKHFPYARRRAGLPARVGEASAWKPSATEA